MSKKLKIGITHGDINGISYELILKVFADNRMTDLFTPVVYGSSKVATFYKNILKDRCENVNFNVVASAENAANKKINLVEVIDEDSPKINPGESTLSAGQYGVAALNCAMRDLQNETLDAVVTCPINKSNVQCDDFHFVGHTEFFAANCGNKTPLMFMISENLKVGLVSIHDPLVKVPSRVNAESVLEKLRLIKQSLVRDFAIVEPKIAVLGINPHAGDCGLLGKEEEEIIKPALDSARYEGIYAFGPFAADGYFGSGTFKKYDATLAIYHDQGLVPFKLLSQLGGVNYTAGLSVVRTSPAHGVGYDIAGKGVADETSLRDAIYAAIDICRNREISDEITANPLQHYSRDNWGKDTSASDIKDHTASSHDNY